MAALDGLQDFEPRTAACARQCRTARRLVERRVGFLELFCLTSGQPSARNPLADDDVRATVLFLLSPDSQTLPFRFGGRELRRLDIQGRLNHDPLA